MSHKTIYTIGHSNRSIDEFVELLKINKIEVLCDIRSFPSSKKWAQFNQDALRKTLASNSIDYVWLGDKLGGFRKKAEGAELHIAISSEGFRAYVAHLLSPSGQAGIEELIKIASKKLTACMCAEKLPFKCHRWFLSDFLILKGFKVVHVIDAKSTSEHKLSPLIEMQAEKPIYKKLQKPTEQKLF